ncbi:hypothetical protein IGI37_001004 [Enterococcus sp. AZ194]|uniref:hypothetical protein n=1 Tax=Enterococcus sp. AZ194 TaxID=2774629 RepID=UPI003F253303
MVTTVRRFLMGLIAFAAFLSLYIGGVLVYLLLFSIVLYAIFELLVAFNKKFHVKN